MRFRDCLFSLAFLFLQEVVRLVYRFVLADVFDFTYGAIKDLLEPILAYYPSTPNPGSPYNTGAATFGLSDNYKRLSSFIGDILFQAPRRHFLRETPKDFGEDSWNFVYVEPREGAEERLGGALHVLFRLCIHPVSPSDIVCGCFPSLLTGKACSTSSGQ